MESSKVPSKVGVGKIKSSTVPSIVKMEKMGFNHIVSVKLPKPVSVELFDSRCIRKCEVLRHYRTNERYNDHCNTTLEEEVDNPLDESTSNSNNDNTTTDITNINIESSKAGVEMIGDQYEDNWFSDSNSYNKNGICEHRDNNSFNDNGIYNNREWLGYKVSNYDDNKTCDSG